MACFSCSGGGVTHPSLEAQHENAPFHVPPPPEHEKHAEPCFLCSGGGLPIQHENRAHEGTIFVFRCPLTPPLKPNTKTHLGCLTGSPSCPLCRRTCKTCPHARFSCSAASPALQDENMPGVGMFSCWAASLPPLQPPNPPNLSPAPQPSPHPPCQ